MKKKLLFVFVAAVLALALAACGGAKLTGITLPQEALKVAVGSTAVLESKFAYDGETPDQLPAVSYTSADEAVATVAADGTVTGVAAGETTITVTAGQVSAQQTVVVSAATETLTAEKLSLHLADGPVQAVYTVEPAELAGQLMFQTGDEAIATVDENGVITPVKEGHTGLLILAPDGTRGKAMITVWSGPKELTLTADKTQAAKGAVVAITAADETGVEVDPAMLTWTSSDEAVATVDETGTVTMVGTGEVTITAETAYEIVGSITLTGKKAGGSTAAGSQSSGSQGGGTAAQPTQPAQPDPAPVPQPHPVPQPEPEQPPADMTSPTVPLDPDAGNDVTLD